MGNPKSSMTAVSSKPFTSQKKGKFLGFDVSRQILFPWFFASEMTAFNKAVPFPFPCSWGSTPKYQRCKKVFLSGWVSFTFFPHFITEETFLNPTHLKMSFRSQRIPFQVVLFLVGSITIAQAFSSSENQSFPKFPPWKMEYSIKVVKTLISFGILVNSEVRRFIIVKRIK